MGLAARPGAWLRRLRASAQIFRWVQAGMPVPPVPAAKRRLLARFQRQYGLTTFVETGTFKGDTLAAMADLGLNCVSIELSDLYFERARARFAGTPNVTLRHGDAGEELPKVVAALDRPALFWLDGHYSSGQTAHGALASPISAELETVLASPIGGHVALIDDAHDFTGEGGYPPLGDLLSAFDRHPRYQASVHANIIVIEPRPAA